jgi:hypothetical protein
MILQQASWKKNPAILAVEPMVFLCSNSQYKNQWGCNLLLNADLARSTGEQKNNRWQCRPTVGKPELPPICTASITEKSQLRELDSTISAARRAAEMVQNGVSHDAQNHSASSSNSPVNYARRSSCNNLGEMAKHTQAHMSKTIEKNKPSGLKDMTKRQMEYYMGAKLIEIGIDPKSAIYRWSMESKGNNEVWTYSAYWGDSKDKLLQQEEGTSTN